MTKVTITASAGGNEPTEIPARAAADLNAALNASIAAPLCLADIVAQANDYAARYVKPAHAAHSVADTASITAPHDAPEKQALSVAADTAWSEWERHCEAYRDIVDPILDLVADTPNELFDQVDAYTTLMVPVWAYKNVADSEIEKLGAEEIRMLAVHMYEGLQRFRTGPDAASSSKQDPSGPAQKASLPDFNAATPLTKAVALRDKLRAEIAAYEDAHKRDAPEATLRKFERAGRSIYTTPAPDLAGVIFKLEENMVEEQGVDTVEEAVAELDAGDLGDTCEVSVYRDLLRLSGRPLPVPKPRLMAAE